MAAPEQVEDALIVLNYLADDGLVAAIKKSCADRGGVLQALADWVTDFAYGSARAFDSRSEGILKSSNEQFGFIECDTTKAQFGCDVFVTENQLPGFSVGQHISFVVFLSKDGKPQAFDLRLVDGGGVAQSKPKPKPVLKPIGLCSATAPALGAMVNGGAMRGQTQLYEGTVKSFKASQGYGFICCPLAKALCGSDVFAHHNELTEEKGTNIVGTSVVFSVQMKNGKPRAHDVRLAQDGACPIAGLPVQQINPQMNGLMTAVGGRFDGTIKSFAEKNGFGFIDCSDIFLIYGADVFVHHKELSEVGTEVGTVVNFAVELNKQGKPQARLVTPGNPAKRARTTGAFGF